MSWPRGKLVRRLLRLPAADDLFEPTGHGTWRLVDSDRLHAMLDRQFAEHHDAGLRERLADAVENAPARLRQRLRWAFERRVGRAAALRAVAEARHLTFGSWHVHTLGDCQEVEGWLEAGGRRYPLTVRALSAQRAQARYAWLEGEVWHEHGDAVVVPEQTLTPELVREAVERWYMQTFEWRRGHWAVRERTLPRIAFQVKWRQPDPEHTPLTETELERQLAAHHERRRRELHGRFGR